MQRREELLALFAAGTKLGSGGSKNWNAIAWAKHLADELHHSGVHRKVDAIASKVRKLLTKNSTFDRESSTSGMGDVSELRPEYYYEVKAAFSGHKTALAIEKGRFLGGIHEMVLNCLLLTCTFCWDHG